MMMHGGHSWTRGKIRLIGVYVLGILLSTAGVALAETDKVPEASSPPSGPSSGEEIQERGLRPTPPLQPGLPTPPRTATPTPYVCNTTVLSCECYSPGDCLEMGRAKVCVANTLSCSGNTCTCTLKQF